MTASKPNENRGGDITREDFFALQRTLSERLDRLHTIMENIGPTPVDEAFSETLARYGGVSQLEENLTAELEAKAKALETALGQKLKGYEKKLHDQDAAITSLREALNNKVTDDMVIDFQTQLDNLAADLATLEKSAGKTGYLANEIKRINRRLDGMDKGSGNAGKVISHEEMRSQSRLSARKDASPSKTSNYIMMGLVAGTLLFVIGFVYNMNRTPTPVSTTTPQTQDVPTNPPAAPETSSSGVNLSPVAANDSAGANPAAPVKATVKETDKSLDCPRGMVYQPPTQPQVAGVAAEVIQRFSGIKADDALLTILGVSDKAFKEDLIRIAHALERDRAAIGELKNKPNVTTFDLKVDRLSVLKSNVMKLTVKSNGKFSLWLDGLVTTGKAPVDRVYKLWVQLAVPAVSTVDALWGAGSRTKLSTLIDAKELSNYTQLKGQLDAEPMDPMAGEAANAAVKLFGYKNAGEYKRDYEAFAKTVAAVPFSTQSAFVSLEGPADRQIFAQTCSEKGPTPFGQWLFDRKNQKAGDDQALFHVWLAMHLGADWADGSLDPVLECLGHLDGKTATGIAAGINWN